MNKCATPYCKGTPQKGRKICGTCRKRAWRKANPMKASYQTMKYNATRRKKPFTITFDYFKQFCYETCYMAGKGRTKESFTVDCEINELGYVPGNIKMRTKSANSRKGKHMLMYDWEHPEYTTVMKS